MKLYTNVFIAIVVTFLSVTTVNAQLYWDINGSTPGSTNTPPDASGNWDDVTANWNNSAGDGVPVLWDDASVAVFAAGGDATGPYTVTVVGTQSAAGITLEDSFFAIPPITITGGQINLAGATPTVTVPVDEEVQINSQILSTTGLTAAGDGALTLGGNNAYTGPTIVSLTSILKLGSSTGFSPNSVLTLTAGTNPAAVQLNGFNATVKSISSGTGAAPTIAIGANTLTLEDDGENQTYTGLYSTTAGGKIVKNGDGTLNLNNFPNAFTGGEFILNDGVVQVSQNNVFGTTANGSKLTINGGTIRKAIGAAGSNVSVANVDINNSFTIDITAGNDFQFIGTGGNMVTTLGADNPTITVVPVPSGTSGVFIFAGRILNGPGSNNRGFTKAGAGTLLLGSPDSDYRGETTILEGVLRVRKQNLANSVGAARIGDGNGRVNLSGGTLQYNGSIVTAGDPRSFTVTNPINITADSSIDYASTTGDVGMAGNLGIDFIFTSNSVTATGGTLGFHHEGTANNNPYRPTFSGEFTFSRPVVIDNHATNATNPTILTSTNVAGTQTWSGAISGTGSIRRDAAGGTTVLTGANTYAGGTTVSSGTLRASGSAATFGDGDVTVTGGALEIAAGVLDAIDDAASLTVTTGGIVSLGAGVNVILAGLTLDSFVAGPGTYGAPGSGATSPGLINPGTYFTGTGILTIAVQGLPGDYNQDDVVDAADFVMWRKLYPNPSGPALPNDDSAGVDLDDYDRWVEQFGESNAGSGGDNSSGQVPEPTSSALFLVALFAAGVVRQRLI